MKLEEEFVHSPACSGTIYHRRFHPGVKARSRVLLLHGLGDHVTSHDRIAERLVSCGFEVHGFDWPGHGHSSGPSGDVPGVEAASRLISETVERGDLPATGVYGHSTGAFLLVHHLRLLKEQGRESGFRWAWMSSPLLSPGHGQPAWKKVLSRTLARVAPRLAFPTGVARWRICHAEEPGTLAGPEEFEGFHHVVSARFGHDLLAHEDLLDTCARHFPEDIRLLLTQGDEDTICPPEFAIRFFEQAGAKDKTLAYFRGVRHDIFRETIRESFHATVRAWLEPEIDRDRD